MPMSSQGKIDSWKFWGPRILLALTILFPSPLRGGGLQDGSFASSLRSSAARSINMDGLAASQVSICDNLFQMLLTGSGSSVVATYDLDGTRIASTTFPEDKGFKIVELASSSDGSTFAALDIGTKRGEGWGESWKTRVYSRDGAPFFTRVSNTSFVLSSSGNYLANSSSDFSSDPFLLLDRQGSERLRIDRYHEWTSGFVDDDTLILVADDSLHLILTASGTTVLSRALGKAQKETSTQYRLAISRPFVGIFAQSELRLYSSSGDELWSTNLGDNIQGVAIDPESERILVSFKKGASQSAYALILLVSDPHRPVCRITHEALSTITASSSGPMFFEDGLVVMWSPRWLTSLDELRQSHPRTIIFNVSPDTADSGIPEVVDGLYLPTRSPTGSHEFIDLTDPNTLTIHQVERREDR